MGGKKTNPIQLLLPNLEDNWVVQDGEHTGGFRAVAPWKRYESKVKAAVAVVNAKTEFGENASDGKLSMGIPSFLQTGSNLQTRQLRPEGLRNISR